MAARPPLRRAGWLHHAAQHDQLSRLAGASRENWQPCRYRRQAEQMRVAKTDADSVIREFAT